MYTWRLEFVLPISEAFVFRSTRYRADVKNKSYENRLKWKKSDYHKLSARDKKEINALAMKHFHMYGVHERISAKDMLYEVHRNRSIQSEQTRGIDAELRRLIKCGQIKPKE